MQMALDNEEACAHWVRRADPWLPDNIAEDELARERYLETGKAVYTNFQFLRMSRRAAAKATPEEKQRCRENVRWLLYDSRLRMDVVH